MTDERTQEIDAIGTRYLARDLARNLDVAPPVDEEAGSAKRERRARGWRGRTAQSTVFSGLKKQPRSLCDTVVRECTMFDERLHHAVRKRRLGGGSGVVVSRNSFERAPKEVIHVTSQELWAYGCIGRVNFRPASPPRCGRRFPPREREVTKSS